MNPTSNDSHRKKEEEGKLEETSSTDYSKDILDDGEAMAKMAIHPGIQGAMVIRKYSDYIGNKRDLISLVQELEKQISEVKDGNLKAFSEKILMNQILTLNTLFNKLLLLAYDSEYLDEIETFMRLAMRAQKQCRSTLETLSAIKNPQSIAFVKQANIGYNQQVNNCDPGSQEAPKVENSQTQLLEEKHGERLDIGTKGTPSTTNQKLATLGKINGSKNY